MECSANLIQGIRVPQRLGPQEGLKRLSGVFRDPPTGALGSLDARQQAITSYKALRTTASSLCQQGFSSRLPSNE